MNKETLEKLLKNEKIELDIYDKLSGITINDKIKWKESEIIEENGICPFCKANRLTEMDPIEEIFACEKCGKFMDKDYILN